MTQGHDREQERNGLEGQGGSVMTEKMAALVIPANGAIPATVVSEVHGLVFLQGIVGGYIERMGIQEVLTDCGTKHVDADMMVNEEGKNIGLRVNNRATDLAALTIGGWVQDVIRGDVVVVGPPDENGDSTPVPAEIVKIVTGWGWMS